MNTVDEAMKCPGCGAEDLAIIEQHVPPCWLGEMLSTKGLDRTIEWLRRAAEYKSRPLPATAPRLVVSDVPCPHCGHMICQACALNGLCQACKVELNEQTLDAFDVWEERRGRR